MYKFMIIRYAEFYNKTLVGTKSHSDYKPAEYTSLIQSASVHKSNIVYRVKKENVNIYHY